VDKRKMIGAIAERLGIRLDENDPAFVLVELNRLALEEAGRDAATALQLAVDKAAADLASAAAGNTKQQRDKNTRPAAGSKLLIVVCLVALGAAAGAAAALQYTNASPSDDQKYIKIGKKFEKVWLKLDTDTRSRIDALSKDE
jgi:hypothetical protein